MEILYLGGANKPVVCPAHPCILGGTHSCSTSQCEPITTAFSTSPSMGESRGYNRPRRCGQVQIHAWCRCMCGLYINDSFGVHRLGLSNQNTLRFCVRDDYEYEHTACNDVTILIQIVGLDYFHLLAQCSRGAAKKGRYLQSL